jgi:hypothetical protein
VIGAGAFSFACSPLFFEFTVELAYPVSEGLVGAFLTAANNFVGFLFLCAFFDGYLATHTVWMNYVMLASSIIAIPMTLLTKENYRRLDVDEGSARDGDDEERILTTAEEISE